MGCSVVALIKKKKQVIDTVDCLDIPTEQKCNKYKTRRFVNSSRQIYSWCARTNWIS